MIPFQSVLLYSQSSLRASTVAYKLISKETAAIVFLWPPVVLAAAGRLAVMVLVCGLWMEMKIQVRAMTLTWLAGSSSSPRGDCQSVFGFNRGAATSSSSFLNISDLCIDLSVQMAGRPLKTVDEATTNEHRVHNRIQVYGGGLQI